MSQAIRMLVALDEGVDREALQAILPIDPEIQIVGVVDGLRGQLDDAPGDAHRPAGRGVPRLLGQGALPRRRRREAAAGAAGGGRLRGISRTDSSSGCSRRGRTTCSRFHRAPDDRPLRAPEGRRPQAGRERGDRRRPLADDLRARPEGRDGEDAHVLQPRGQPRPERPQGGPRRPRPPVRRRRARSRARPGADDLRPGEVGRLARRREARRLPRDPSLGRAGADGAHPSGSRRSRDDGVPARGLRGAACVARLRDRRHAARLHARGDRLDRQLLARLHGGDARLALAQEHEARARDARAHGLRRRAYAARPQPGRQPRGDHARRRRGDHRAQARRLRPERPRHPALGQPGDADRRLPSRARRRRRRSGRSRRCTTSATGRRTATGAVRGRKR